MFELCALAIAASALAATLLLVPAWALVEGRIFDLASTLSPVRPPEPGALIVAIDEPSFAEIGRQWPWPRDIHARLVESLRRAGAKAIGLDIIFAEPSTAVADATLAAAMGPDVTLAADQTRIETPQAEQTIRVDPIPELTAKQARSGLVAIGLEGDGTVRRLPAYGESFAAIVLQSLGRTATTPPAGALIQFFGPARSYDTISYYQALDPERFLPKGALEGKTVLVGLSLQNAPAIDKRGADVFATPFSFKTGRLTAGVEVQATILDNLAHGLFIRPASILGSIATILAVALGAGLLTRRRVTWRSSAIALGAAVGILVASFLVLQAGRIWISPALPLLAGTMVLGVQGGRDFVAERRQRRAITRAFSHYLAPELVEKLVQDPSLLRLGGERRRLTILFCDVRGFTTLAEQLRDDPERLTSLINRLLDPLSETVLSHGGTIDKYIGDCIMAFWNAPLDDPRQEHHAVTCALAMLDSLQRLNRALAQEDQPDGVPAFSIGIGINTGECIVGNMGSTRRFDYSALGDAVNLASRLEGISKRYGVPLIIGADTARVVSAEFVTVELDLIAVKGRNAATPIHTVLGARRHAEPSTKTLLARHAAMLAAYRAQRWNEALDILAECRGRSLELTGYYDAVETFIGELVEHPPGPSWRGVHHAETK